MSDHGVDSSGTDIRAQNPIPVAIVSQPDNRNIDEIERDIQRLEAQLREARTEQRLMHDQNQKATEEGTKLVNDYLRWRDHTDFRLQIVQWSAIVGAIASVFRALQDFLINYHHGS